MKPQKSNFETRIEKSRCAQRIKIKRLHLSESYWGSQGKRNYLGLGDNLIHRDSSRV